MAELETHLQTLQMEHNSEQERLRCYREEHDKAHLIQDRLEQERNKACQQLEEEQQQRQATLTTATLSTRLTMPPNQSTSHCRRDPREESPRRHMAGPSMSFAMPYPTQLNMAGSSNPYPSTAHRSSIEHPMVDFENTSSDEEVDKR
ncbi:uncharacterized protein TRAVEDRAFT_48099 [Trametes versicolor FP-101664 SS1]|uniref:uncharacterized protein n=1 Tax=Trametes versicolor (strain FP-101664) TaxID=717944 RepID=UPI0004621E3A|nr:uncharacterized protein TRAVEDRAFT_48099 [Trametes versicolor FP-101664 SS1]EIW58964.1 hypothetical protein TRAVEDRAFT_48099 [Trametes versicolor FP-101664 SS1]